MSDGLTTASLRAFVIELADRLRLEGMEEAAGTLSAAAAEKLGPPEDLLVLREALVRTRSDWRRLDAELRARGADALNAAKRLAIEM